MAKQSRGTGNGERGTGKKRQAALPFGEAAAPAKLPRARSLTAPPAPPAISERKATQLLAELAQLDADRLELNRHADSLKKQIDAIESQLFAFVAAAAKTARSKVRSVSLKKWRVSIIAVAKSLYYKAELEKEIGVEEVEKRRAALGTKDVLQVESIA